jgi:DNA-binding beta-propeller fold protein YncE
VFLSGEGTQSNPNFEDTILRGFYTRLRALLQSQTFCAMFDKARQFPAYPYTNLGITTIFGKGQKTRFRVAPGGGVGYAVGAGNTINIFDLARGEMVEELVFPGAPNVVVEDVAIARDGRQLYAIATMNDKDTLFAIADIAANGLGHVFRAPTLICDVQLVSLAIAPAPSLNVLAIGKTKGLYDINPLNPVNPANPTAPIPTKYTFNAVGHLVTDQNFAYATASSGTTATDTYNRVMKLDLAATTPNPPVFPLTFNNQQLTGEDDIAFGVDQQRKLFVAVNPPPNQTEKHLLVYNTDVVATPLALTNLQQNTTIRLAHNPLTDHLMVAYEDIYRVGMVNAQNTLIAEWVPVQIGPIWIAVSPDETRVYVLNYWSNTISSIPAARFAAGQQIPLQPLVDYRAGVLNAIVDLFGGLLQYLKDCFCDHLLVDCPTCDEEDEIYLACISIKNNKVHKVCNFSHRKYVHTFPTWEYWLSIVPILPIVKDLVARLCCAELPALFGRYMAPTPAPPVNTTIAPQNAVNSSSFRRGATILGRADFRGTIDEQRLKVKTGGGVINDALASITTRTFTTRPPVTHTDVAGRTVADARQKLASANIAIAGEQEYDPAAGGRNLSRYLAAPVRLAPGDRVNLVTKEGKVLFYTKGEEPLPDLVRTRLDASVAETLQLRQEVTTLRSELLQVRQAHQSDIQTRDAQIATLQATVRDAQSAAQSVRDFRDRLERLERRP